MTRGAAEEAGARKEPGGIGWTLFMQRKEKRVEQTKGQGNKDSEASRILPSTAEEGIQSIKPGSAGKRSGGRTRRSHGNQIP